ncbi:hypothetical protein F2P81_010647 [Scophthalmus maximus]|uniref:Uncharacterized protein n=1 Tax=Scophthalmus maximus TaxID=52904 RepID=A0A6A4SUZ9_SCOMX|nr:hypothetical protein F2P81_010647 [Scophthalmus maximus]
MIATRVMLQTFAMAPHSPPDTNIMEDLSTDLERAVHTRWCANLARRTRGLLREGMQILRTRIQQRYESISRSTALDIINIYRFRRISVPQLSDVRIIPNTLFPQVKSGTRGECIVVGELFTDGLFGSFGCLVKQYNLSKSPFFPQIFTNLGYWMYIFFVNWPDRLRIGREYGKKQDERETEEMKSEREFPLIRKLTEASVVSLKWVKSRTHPAAAWLFECSRCIGSNHNDIVCLCMCMRSRVGRLTAGVTAPLC